MSPTINARESDLIVLRSVANANCPSRAWTQESEPRNIGDQVVLSQLHGWAERSPCSLSGRGESNPKLQWLGLALSCVRVTGRLGEGRGGRQPGQGGGGAADGAAGGRPRGHTQGHHARGPQEEQVWSRWSPAVNSEHGPSRMGQGGVRAWMAGRAEAPEGAEETVILEKLEKVIPEVPS